MFGWFRRKQGVSPKAVVSKSGAAQPGPQRCPLNAPGAFYTTGQCLACEAPETEAPDLLAPLTQDNHTTYFVRQPQTGEEVERACRAIEVCCVMDLRYGGTDRTIIERLGNDPFACDYVILEGKVVRSDKAPDAASTLEGPG